MSISSLFDLTGRVAVVSGAAQGMGRAMATALAEAGADVMLVDKNTAGVQRTADEIAALGRRAVPAAWITGAIIPMDGGNLAMNAGGTKGPVSAGN